jgi:hypothetical protein
MTPKEKKERARRKRKKQEEKRWCFIERHRFFAEYPIDPRLNFREEVTRRGIPQEVLDDLETEENVEKVRISHVRALAGRKGGKVTQRKKDKKIACSASRAGSEAKSEANFLSKTEQK